MKPIVRCLFVVAGLLATGASFSQDFKNQATAAASQWDNAFNSGDASKVAQGYTKTAVILPAGGEQVTGQQGAETLFGEASRKASLATPKEGGRPTPEARKLAVTGLMC